MTTTETQKGFSTIGLINKTPTDIIRAFADEVENGTIDLLSMECINSNDFVSIAKVDYVDLSTNERIIYKTMTWKTKEPLTKAQEDVLIDRLQTWGITPEQARDFVLSKPIVNKEPENG